MGGPGWNTKSKISGIPEEYQQMVREEQVKHKRASERLDRDCRIACHPQIDTPFSSAMDALERLLPFHVRPRRGIRPDAPGAKNNGSAEGWCAGLRVSGVWRDDGLDTCRRCFITTTTTSWRC